MGLMLKGCYFDFVIQAFVGVSSCPNIIMSKYHYVWIYNMVQLGGKGALNYWII